MNQIGPTLEHLLRRLIETPTDFLAEPYTIKGGGIVHLSAVAADLLTLYGHSEPDLTALDPDDSASSLRRAEVSLLLCWLLADPQLVAGKISAPALVDLLDEGASEMASQNDATQYRNDSERREELVRFSLARLDLRPCGESLTQAQDRLSALSSIERNRVLAASREAEARSRAVREALARKAAQESADKYTRE